MVASIDFSYGKANNMKTVQESGLTVVTPNKRYQTPDRFIESSLIVTVNGLVKDRTNDNGVVVLSDQEFELKVAKLDKHFLQVYYLAK